MLRTPWPLPLHYSLLGLWQGGHGARHARLSVISCMRPARRFCWLAAGGGALQGECFGRAFETTTALLINLLR